MDCLGSIWSNVVRGQESSHSGCCEESSALGLLRGNQMFREDFEGLPSGKMRCCRTPSKELPTAKSVHKSRADLAISEIEQIRSVWVKPGQ